MEFLYIDLIVHSDCINAEKRLQAAQVQLPKRGVPLASNQVHFAFVTCSNYYPRLMNGTNCVSDLGS
jgi:hypothetical protein